MLVRLTNPKAHLSLVVVAVLLLTTLSFLSVRNALAVHELDLNTRAGYQRAVQLEPGNFDNWHLLGRYWQYNVVEEIDSSRAIAAYQTALALNPASSDTWLDLATVYETEGRTAEARNAFLQAKRAYPLSAEVSWRYGNFLLREQQFPQAFAEIRRAAYIDPQRSGEAFSRCWRVDPDVHAILDKVIPPDSDGYLDIIHGLTDNGLLAPALAVWDRLVRLQPKNLPLIDPGRLSNALLESHQLDDALRVWIEAVRLSGLSPTGDPAHSVIWDGGFETGLFTPEGFAWSLSPPPRGVTVTIDAGEKHSGRRSLRLDFDGKHNVRFESVCTKSIVRPSTPYVFSAWVRTRRLTTDEGIRFRLYWQENSSSLTAETPDVHGTESWTQIQLPWTSPKDVRLVHACVVRNTSGQMDGRIQGTAWIDDVSLIPQISSQAQP